jgi:hypothetical protein
MRRQDSRASSTRFALVREGIRLQVASSQIRGVVRITSKFLHPASSNRFGIFHGRGKLQRHSLEVIAPSIDIFGHYCVILEHWSNNNLCKTTKASDNKPRGCSHDYRCDTLQSLEKPQPLRRDGIYG